MNGDHARIFDKIGVLEVAVAEIKVDTKYIRSNVDAQATNCRAVVKGFNGRVNVLEAWRYKMIGVAGLVSFLGVGGILLVLKAIGW